PSEISALFNNKLEPDRTAEIQDRMLDVCFPI
ncbi:phosphoribulokinase, partial [Klebsiella pneumoniae]